MDELERRVAHLEQQQAIHSRVISGDYPTGTPALIDRFEHVATRLDDIYSAIMGQLAQLQLHRQRAVWVLVGYGIGLVVLTLLVVGLLILVSSHLL